jgi:hypothetical protein
MPTDLRKTKHLAENLLLRQVGPRVVRAEIMLPEAQPHDGFQWAAGELKVITGAEPKEEIGGIVDIYMRKMGNPAVLFHAVPGFPKGHRVIANILTSIPRVNLALGLPPETAEMEQIQWWRNYFKNAPSRPTKAVNGGPLLDNVFAGNDVNIEKIPTRTKSSSMLRCLWNPGLCAARTCRRGNHPD